jgi:hypothetical protein
VSQATSASLSRETEDAPFLFGDLPSLGSTPCPLVSNLLGWIPLGID